MQKIFIVFSLSIVCLWACHNNRTSNEFPKPTNGETEVRLNSDDAGNAEKRQKWFDILHQSAPGIYWKDVEAANALQNLEIINALRKQKINSRSNEEWVAGGQILGAWYERGSTNQAGNVIATAYDTEKDEIFVVSGGGSIFKGSRIGFGWEVINQDLRFSPNFMDINHLEDGSRRLIAAINNLPHFSEDEGKTWEKATGILGQDNGYLYHTAKNRDQQLFFLQKASYWAPIWLYTTKDGGKQYTKIKNFNTHENRNIAMCMDPVTHDLYVISQTAEDKSSIFKYSYQTEEWAEITVQSPLAFGANGEANLQVSNTNGLVKLYAYNGDLLFHVSEDFGKTWQLLSTLPTRPWSVSLFVSPSNPNHMIYGEVDAFRSRDAGKTWQKINGWWEYYNNVQSKLHADIMALKEYTDADGNPFVLISNHGGMSITYDMGINNDNIGLFDLNVSQYYDVKSYPPDYNYTFAGSQDQGFQKAFVPGTSPESFVQVISGDYGHIAFTENGLRLWTVYPGGWVTYYPTPLSSGNVASFEVNSEQESVWIPPLVSSPIASENAVYMAGGNINGGPGSHLIKLTYNQSTNQINASQYPFNFRQSGGELSAIAFSPFNPDKIYCATTNGRIYTSFNGGQNFAASSSNLPDAQYLYGSFILPSAIDSNIVYIAGSGYSTPGVMVSKNGGKTFTAMRTGLPNTTVFELAFNEDESLIYAATEAGPYVYVAENDRWYLLSGSNTPNQTFWSVEYLPEIKVARFGTYGRGIWDFHFKERLSTSQNNVVQSAEFDIFPNPARDRLHVIKKNNQDLVNSFLIFNVQGERMDVPVIKSNNNQWVADIMSLPAGIYLISDGNVKQGHIKKFIKL
jgi:hypothetical protein